jgi:3-deoxy-D-arabino-heptulosonate 7-phosphate (DAHP) synthase
LIEAKSLFLYKYLPLAAVAVEASMVVVEVLEDSKNMQLLSL